MYCRLQSRPPVRHHHERPYLRTYLTKTLRLGRWWRHFPCYVCHGHGVHVAETQAPPLCQQAGAINTQPPFPQWPKPEAGILVFARLPFLDSKVTRCYGCGDTLKPSGTTPSPPDDLVLTIRLHRRYFKDRRQHMSPDISSVYYHVNPYCIRITFPAFQPNVCRIPPDLQPFLLPEHKQLIF